MTQFVEMLAGGDRRSPGRSAVVAAIVLDSPERIDELVSLVSGERPLIKMRAADACEKVSQKRPDLLQPYVEDLLDLAEHERQQEVCWHLALILPRLDLTGPQRRAAFETFSIYTTHESRIVRTNAMQALADFAREDPSLRNRALEIIRPLAETGSPAMRSRGRKLIQLLEGDR